METENVKERLNTLLHKKLSENERKSKEAENLNAATEEQADQAANGKQVADKADGEKETAELSPPPDYLCTHYLLHEILCQKKRALLQNKEVVELLRNKASLDS